MNKNRISKIKLPILCIVALCLAALFISFHNVRHDSDDSYVYFCRRINGKENAGSEDYYFAVGGNVIQFSMPDQEITGRYSPWEGQGETGRNSASIDIYAIGEGYIFMETDRGNPDISGRIWKYDMATHTCELFMEKSRSSYMTVYDGFLLFGERDMSVCPVDGNPGEECISLFEQFPDLKVSVSDRVGETDFRGWRVWSYWSHGSPQIEAAVDVEDNRVVLPSQSFSWFWTGEEWVIFEKTAPFFYYRREKEPKQHQIDCLSDSRYSYSDFRSDMVTWEDGKIIGMLTVSKDPNSSILLGQYAVRNDLLFEIDMEMDTSRILYSTKNNETRIIGYRDGVVYLLRDDAVYQEELGGGERLELLDLQESGLNLYNEDGKHLDLAFDWQGDNLIIRHRNGSSIISVNVSECGCQGKGE